MSVPDGPAARPAEAPTEAATEAARWLGAPLRPARVVVHGVAGGVGATTVAELLRSVLRSPLSDVGGAAGDPDGRPTVDDAGDEALLPGAGDLAVVPVVVCPATAAGFVAAARLLGVRADTSPVPTTGPASRRAVVVAVPVSGRGLDGRAALAAARGAGVTDEVVALPWSRALAAGAGPAAAAVDPVLAGRVAALGAAVVRCARWRAAVASTRAG